MKLKKQVGNLFRTYKNNNLKLKHLLQYATLALVCIFNINICLAQAAVSSAEATAFATKMQEALRTNDSATFTNSVDIKSVCKHANANATESEFLAEVFKGMSLGGKIVGVIQNNGSYEFVKQFEKDNKRYVLFRLFTSDYTINYHELELCKVGDAIKIADLYFYISGEALSETLINLYRNFLADDSKVDIKASKRNKAISVTLPKMRALKAEGKFKEALATYNTLPAEFKTNKTFLLNKVLITQNLDDKTYISAIEEYKKINPKAEHINLLMLDAYTYRKQYDKAQEAIDTLDANINTDPFLDYYRYLIYNLQEAPERGIVTLEKAAKNLPNNNAVQLELIAVYKDLPEKKTIYEKMIAAYKANTKFNQALLETIIKTE
jgi:tetratricopeptide (TPR) repeat protein